jgi:hypothetical protein
VKNLEARRDFALREMRRIDEALAELQRQRALHEKDYRKAILLLGDAGVA